MKVYHGSTEQIEQPDVRHSFRNLDFGKGFYVTGVKEQAERWALRKKDIFGGCAIISEYDLQIESINGNILDFGDNLDEWLDFVCDCRNGSEEYRKYDLIIGKVADDKVYRVVDMYRKGIWDKSRAIAEMKIYKTYHQIAFISQNAIDEALRFISCYEV